MSRTSSHPTTPSALPSLVPHGRFKGKPGMSLGRPATVIGSRSRSHIHLVSAQVSKSHAMVVNGGSSGCYVRDLASRTHVLVNGQQVKESELKDGDVVGVGPFSFRFTDPNKKHRRRGGVQTNIPAGALRISTRALPFTLDARTTLIGRRATCDVAIDDMDVSTTHAVVFELDGKRFIRDLGSRTGTFVNGTPVHQEPLEFGDEIKIGPAVITYAEASELAEGIGSGLPDATEDLAATAELPAVDSALDLVFDDRPVKQAPPPPARTRPERKAPAAPVSRIADLEQALPLIPPATPAVPVEPVEAAAAAGPVDIVEPASVEPLLSEVDLDLPPQTPANLDELDLLTLEPAAEGEAPTAGVPEEIEPSQESALGIELLPHDEEHAADIAAAPVAPAAEAPQAKPADVGGIEDLDLAPVVLEPVEAASPPPPPAPVVEAPALAAPPPQAPKPAVAERDVNELPELPPELAEELELEPVDLDDVEVLAKTEPTPESALDLDRALPVADGASLEPQGAAPSVGPAELLSDSMLGREVEAFEGPGLGPIVEASKAVAAAEAPAEMAPSESSPGAAELAPPAPPEIEPEVEALIFEEPAPAASKAEAEADVASVPEIPEAVEAAPAPGTPPLTLDHTVTPSQPEPAGAVESSVEPSLPVAAKVAEPEMELDLAPAAEAAPATPDHEPAPAEPDLAELGAESAPAVGRLPEPVADVALPVEEAPAAIELELESEPVVATEPIAETPAPAEAEPEAVGEAEVPASAEELAKAEDAVEHWYRDHADEPQSIVRPEGVPAAAEATRPANLAELAESGEAEPVADEPFPINPELLGEDLESSPAAAAAGDPLVFQEEAVSAEFRAEIPAEEPAVSGEPIAAIDAEAERPASPVADQPAESVGEAPAEQTPGKPADLFLGLERDTASFLGGMPLQLPPLQSPFAQQRVDFTRPPQAPAAPAPTPQSEPVAPAAEAEEPLPEFDHEAFEFPDEPQQETAEAVIPAVEPTAPPPELPVAPPAPAAPGAARAGRPAPPPPARSTRERQPRDRDRDAGRESQGSHAPARRAASSPFDLNFEDVPTDRIEIPPFGGAPTNATRGQVTTAFDGLAMPPVRETDVFSNNRAPGSPAAGATPAIPPFPGGAGTWPAPRQDGNELDEDDDLEVVDLGDSDITEGEGSHETRGGGGGDDANLPETESDAEDGQQHADAGAAATEESRRARPLAQSNRRPPSYPTDPAGAAGAGGSGRPAAKKKRWRIGKWGIFGLMMVCMIAVSGGMALWIRTHPNLAQILATIKFDRLETLTEAERQKVLAEQRAKLSKPEVRAAARDILPGIQANLSPGFLDDRGAQGGSGVEAAVTFSKFADSMKLDERNKGAMRLQHATSDPAGDGARVRAVLAALYAENKPLIDAWGEIDHQRDEKQEALRNAQAKLGALDASVAAARQAAGEAGGSDAVGRKADMINALQVQQTKLLQAWNEKTAALHRVDAELRAAESDVPVVAAADAAAKQPVQPSEDPQVIELTRKAELLAAGLKAKKADATANAEAARKSLAGAIKQFEDDIAKARGEMKPDSDLARYLDQAERVQSQLKVISGELDARQRSDMERLTTLKRNLSDANESRIRDAFSADPQLKKLQETMAMKERQRGSAVGGGLKDDERALDKEIAALKLEIESRQDLLTTADGVAPRMKQLGDLINDFLKQMDQDRVRNDQRMAELLKQLASQAPVAGSLPAEQKAFAEQLNKRQAELNKARERYAAAADAAASESDATLKSMETDLAAAQAKVDERKKQVADAARTELTAEQQKDRTAMTEALRHRLQLAQQEDREAGDAFNKNRQTLEDAKSDLDKARRSAQQFARQDADKRELDEQIKTLSDEVQRLTKLQEAAIIPIKPGDDDVRATGAAADHRLTYMLGALLAIALLFLPLLVMAPSHPEHVGDDRHDGAYAYAVDPSDTIEHVSDLPLAAPTASAPDDGALAAAMKVETATADAASSRDRAAGRGEPAPVGA